MIDKLEMFIALANERHFGRAAEAVGVTQPTLSSAIRQLEDILGVQLVRRGARFEALTPEGERVYERALVIVGDVRAMREEMRAARIGLSGELRIGVIPTALPMVHRLTAPYSERHPEVTFRILSRAASEIMEEIDRLELDAGITYTGDSKRHLEIPLYEENYCLLVAADAEEAGRDSISWAEVGRLPLCLLTTDMQNRRIIDRLLDAAGTPARPIVESNSTIVLASHVATGRWASVMPVLIAESLGPGRGLVTVPIRRSRAGNPGRMVGLIVARRDPHSPTVNALLTEARALADRERL